ncbi:hypothetical protein ACFYKX_19405 [Cytobacillus sp. FJAT-54145]|uniref:DUF916 domain-containing protein n=1 Tax=Cytobacillus spartinae TaxID=3299023 RepID=A0ABW6KGC2_9BACI
MKIKAIAITILMLPIILPFSARGMTIEELPSHQTSKQWSVTIHEADKNGPNIRYSKMEPYHTYSMVIKNIGKNTPYVRVQAFRNELNSRTMFGLFAPVEPVQLQKRGKSFQFANFPVKDQATQIEIVITWKVKGSKKELKETFSF